MILGGGGILGSTAGQLGAVYPSASSIIIGRIIDMTGESVLIVSLEGRYIAQVDLSGCYIPVIDMTGGVI